jgi:hypothetical protein
MAFAAVRGRLGHRLRAARSNDITVAVTPEVSGCLAQRRGMARLDL